MNLDELQSVQSRERQTDQLQQLRSTFYEEAGTFVAQLREERDRAADRADDPFDSPEVNRLTDDIKTAEQTVEAIYERRIGKIVKMASLAAADMPTEDDGLTREEEHLFESMVDSIESNREHVLDVIAGDAPAGAVGGDSPATDDADSPATDDAESEPTATADQSGERTADPAPDQMPDAVPDPPEQDGEATQEAASVDAADVMGGGDGRSSGGGNEGAGAETQTPPPERNPDRPSDEAAAALGDADGTTPSPPTEDDDSDASAETDGATAADVERKTVRITDDVGEIFGVDQREYDLSTDDVVTLPADNADPLVERDAAEPLE
ncbi:hypothetical protein [Haloarcula nitratireducens]|uniref:DNA replication factor GINS n=1 Tax=Haloarcula nitratireducens TaxID=2487749 RepID=A0AAW4PAB4_9EURY|nr:hypothetical protein [Halomicroarcula nitratireducens]MBX0294410.1 hypothetical protein [Halomicroarcula nitratireducens]